MLKDYYDFLQIATQAALQDIKQACRRLAMIYHLTKARTIVMQPPGK